MIQGETEVMQTSQILERVCKVPIIIQQRGKELKFQVHYRLKNLLLYFFPFSYGHYRKFRSMIDESYIHERDKHQIRNKHFGSEGWMDNVSSEIRYRDYSNYEEYLIHQKLKWDEMLKSQGGASPRLVLEFRRKFYRRFGILHRFLAKDAIMICAGARQGTEVEVLRDLGFANAIGIDLNPGPSNPYVKVGDFMHMENHESSVDFIYSNSVDHAFNLQSFFSEHARVLKSDGYAMYDLELHGGGPFEAVQWINDEAVFQIMLRYFQQVVEVRTEPERKWILLRGKRQNETV